MAIDIDKLLHCRRVVVTVLDHRSVDANTVDKIIDENSLSITEMSNILGVRKSTVEHWRSGRTIPNDAKMLLALLEAHPEVIKLIMTKEIVEG